LHLFAPSAEGRIGSIREAICGSPVFNAREPVAIRDRFLVEVLGEARGQRVMIRSVHVDGTERRTAVKLVNLLPLDSQLF
jgi:hypothetical protein